MTMGKRFIIPPFTFEHMGSPPIQPAIMFVDYAHPPIIKGKYFDANAARGTAKAKDQARARVKQERRGQGIRKMTIYPTTLELPPVSDRPRLALRQTNHCGPLLGIQRDHRTYAGE